MCNLYYFYNALNSSLELCKIMYNLVSVLYIITCVILCPVQCRLY